MPSLPAIAPATVASTGPGVIGGAPPSPANPDNSTAPAGTHTNRPCSGSSGGISSSSSSSSFLILIIVSGSAAVTVLAVLEATVARLVPGGGGVAVIPGSWAESDPFWPSGSAEP